MTESQTSMGFQLWDYWKVVKRRKWIVGIFALVTLSTTAVLTIRQPKEYLATTTIHLDMVAPRVVDFDESSTLNPRLSDYQAFYNTQYQILNSRSVRQGTLDRLIAAGYHDWDGLVDPLAAFTTGIQITTIKDTRLLSIGYIHRDPKKAAEIANLLATVYTEENLARKVDAMKRADRFLQEQSEKYLAEMIESNRQLLDYKKKNDLLSMEQKETIFQKNLAEIYETYNQARSERLTAESEYSTLNSMLKRGETDALVTYFSTPTLQRLKDQLNDVDKQYVALSERYLPKFPQMEQLNSERQTLRQKILEELGRLVQGKEAEFKLKKNREESLQAELNRVKLESGQLEERLVGARELLNKSERSERFFKQLDKRQGEIDVVQTLIERNSNIEVIDHAISPRVPFKPNLMSNMLMALMVSLTGGIGLAFAAEYLDRKFKSGEEVEQMLGVRLLGIFPLMKRTGTVEDDLYVYKNSKSPVAECCRSIRTNINMHRPDKPIRTLLVTSASPREGKSTLVVSLGITMAQAGRRTLIVDTDLRRPRLHHVFNHKHDLGFTDIVEDGASIDDCLLETGIPGLFILTAGRIPEHPSEVLGSTRVPAVIEALKQRFDTILFDSPPCIAVTDAVVLANLIDATIFVINQESTTKEDAMEARRRLSGLGEKLIGCVLNNIDTERDSYGYRYYYYYYHYGDESGEQRKSA